MHFKADLHCHSCYSDGTLPPHALIDLALSKNLGGLSITDHDTIGALKEGLSEATRRSLRFISGIEFSSSLEEFPIHILGYSFQLNHPAILTLSDIHKARRLQRNSQILKKLSSFGMPITLNDIRETLPHMQHQIGRVHIAYTLYKKGFVKSVEEAFSRWIGDDKVCFAPSIHPSIKETIEAIHAAGGFAVIAHPHLIKKRAIIKALLKHPFDGIECRYALFNPSVNQRFLDLAKDRKLFITGGSDFHGEIRPQNPLGASFTDETVFTFLEDRFLNHLNC